jgi:hypothetical protein
VASIAETSRILWISPSTDLFNRVLSIDPQNQERLAYCAHDEIQVSIDAGNTWEGISTTGAASAAADHGFRLFSSGSPSSSTCINVTLDPGYPSTLYAIFTAAEEQFGAPPVFYLGFFTTDNGDTWHVVPAPGSSTLEQFGGFWNLGDEGIEALFNSDSLADNIVVIETGDGGETWQPGKLSCPTLGPCVRWGPAPSNIPGMGSPLPQEILSSSDGGSTWESVDPPIELRAPAPNQLVAFSDYDIAIVSGSIGLADSDLDASPLRLSQDKGLRFQPIELPPLASNEIESNYFPGLQLLPDESYLSQDPETSAWFRLNPEQPTWCRLDVDSLPPIPQLLQYAGGKLWWTNDEINQIEYILLSELGCEDS